MTKALSIAERLEGLGIRADLADAAPDAKETALRGWIESLDGTDPLRTRAEREFIVGLGLSAGLVDAALAARPRPEREEDGRLQGSAPALEDPEPWPDPVDGADLLDDLSRTLRLHLVLPEGAADALPPWIVHTHAHDAAEVSPIAAVTSAVKGCGKTSVLHLLTALVPRPLPAANVTPAVVFRAVEKYQPTLLVDEADTYLLRHDELRGILNSGHLRGMAQVVRSVGDDHEPRVFRTWAPKAIALIGKLPATLADRSIEIRMRRRLPGETVERLRLDRLSDLEPLRRRAWRWAQDHLEDLRASDPDVPTELRDRAADNWRALLAIADVAGGEWPDRARRAALLLTGAAEEDGDGDVGVLLLADIRDLFEALGSDRLPSGDIAAALAKLEDRPWPEWGRQQKPISATGIARILRPFQVRPKRLRIEGETAGVRGYERADLEDAWERYVPSDLEPPETQAPRPPHSQNDAKNRQSPDRHGTASRGGSETRENTRQTGDVAGVALGSGEPGGREASPLLWDVTLADPGELAEDLDAAVGDEP